MPTNYYCRNNPCKLDGEKEVWADDEHFGNHADTILKAANKIITVHYFCWIWQD